MPVAHWRNWVARARVDPIADGNNRIQIVVIDLTRHLAGTLGLNCSEFPKSCVRADLTLLKDVLQVFVDGWNRDLKQPCHQLLGEPDGFILVAHFQPVPAGLGGENKKLSGGVADVLFVGHKVEAASRRFVG